MMRTIDRRSNWRRTNGRRPRALARWLLTLVVGLGASGLGETLWAQYKDIVGETKPVTTPTPAATSGPVDVKIEGTYRALLIGIDKYKDERIQDLESAVKDVNAVKEMLQKRYGFDSAHVISLLNEKATQQGIEDAFTKITNLAEEKDSVFIYYAGHGDYKEIGGTGAGSWVPSDATNGRDTTYYSNDSIKRHMKIMKAKHVYLVADTCFAGSILGDDLPTRGRTIQNLYKKSSRQVLTSGDKERVADGTKSDNSVFAESFLDVLNDNTETYLMAETIYNKVKILVSNNQDQVPQSGRVKILVNPGYKNENGKDRGGQFVFRLTDVTGSQTQGTNSTSGSVSSVNNSAQGGPKKKPEDQWKTMLELLDTLLEEKTS